MWILRISLDLYGDNFSPGELLKNLTDSIHVFHFNEPNDLNDKDPKGIYGFGSLSILCPQIYGLQYKIAYYEEWYLDFIERNIGILKKYGVTEINLFIEFFHNGGQLNFEIFSRELLKKIVHYEIAIPISYYQLTTQQLADMLAETNFTKGKD